MTDRLSLFFGVFYVAVGVFCETVGEFYVFYWGVLCGVYFLIVWEFYVFDWGVFCDSLGILCF